MIPHKEKDILIPRERKRHRYTDVPQSSSYTDKQAWKGN
jgi:hypothetical protein